MPVRSTLVTPTLALLAIAAFSGCEKDKDRPNGGTLDQPLFLYVDSACVQVPNVFTPNGDGINDILVALGRNVSGLRMDVRTLGGDPIWEGDGSWPGWDGRKDGVLLPNRPYRVLVSAVSFSGTSLKGATNVFLAGDPLNTCFDDEQEPITSDMFDPLQCAPIYFSNDRFCTAP